MASSFEDWLRAVATANRGNASLPTSLLSNQAPNQQAPTPQIISHATEDPETREMSGIERIFAQLAKTGEGIAGVSGFDGTFDEFSDVPKFLLGLPAGIVSAIPSGAAQMYEAFTGAPVQDANLEANTIAKDYLTGEQKWGSAVEGGINLIGGTAGGTGRVLGTVAKGLSGGKVGNRMATGIFGGAKQIGADIAEETGEEFVQSLANQTRYEQDWDFGAAGSAAAMGALGGTIMSGSMMAVNKVLDSESKKSQDSFSGGGSPSYLIEQNAPDWSTSRNIVTAASRDVLSDKQSLSKRMAGSYKGANPSDNVDIVSATLGSVVMRESWMGSSTGLADPDNLTQLDEKKQKARQDLAARLQLPGETIDDTIQDLDSAFNEKDVNVMNDRVNTRVLDKISHDGPIKFTVARNPDTSERAVFSVNLIGTTPNANIGLNQLVPIMIGADQDGDSWTAYMNDADINSGGYMTRNLISSITGKTLGDIDKYLGIFSPDAMLSNANSPRRNDPLWSIKLIMGKDYTDELASKLSAAFKTTGGINKDVMGKELTKLVADLSKKRRDDWDSANRKRKPPKRDVDALAAYFDERSAAVRRFDDEADAIVARLLLDSRAQTAEDTAYRRKMIEFDENLKAEFAAPMTVADSNVVWQTKGKVPDNVTMMDYLYHLGFLTNHPDDDGNPSYRRHFAFYQYTQAVPFLRSLENQPENIKDAYKFAFLKAFRLIDVATDPVESIETVFNKAVFEEVLYTTHLYTNKFGPGTNLNDFLEVLARVKNEIGVEYNKAKVEAGLSGPMFMMLSTKPEDLDPTNYMEMGRALIETFRYSRLDDIFDMTGAPDWIKNQLLEDALYDAASQPFGGAMKMDYLSEDALVAWKMMLSGYNTSRLSQETAIIDAIEKLDTSSDMLQIVDGNWQVRPEYMQESANLLAGMNYIMGNQRCFNLGLHDMDVALSTLWGRDFWNHDPEVKINSMVRAVLYHDFSDYITLYNSAKGTGTELDTAFEYAAQLSNQGPLHRAIVDDIVLNNGEPVLLKLMLSDTDYNTKRVLWDEMQEDKSIAMKEPLIVSAIRTSGTDMASSEIATNVKKAKSHFDVAQKRCRQRNLETIESLVNIVDSNKINRQTGARCLTGLCNNVAATISDNLAVGLLYEGWRVSKRNVEKSQDTPAAAMLSQAIAKAHDGQATPWLVGMTQFSAKNFTIEELAQNPLLLVGVIGGSESLNNVTDNGLNQADIDNLTQAVVFEQVLGRPLKNAQSGPDWDEWISLLRAMPALASYITETKIVGVNMETPGVTQKQVIPLNEAVINYAARESDAIYWQEKRAKQTIRMNLYKDPDFHFAFEACFADINEHIEPERFRSRALQYINQWVDAYYDNTVKMLGSGKEEILRNAHASIPMAVSEILVRAMENKPVIQGLTQKALSGFSFGPDAGLQDSYRYMVILDVLNELGPRFKDSPEDYANETDSLGVGWETVIATALDAELAALSFITEAEAARLRASTKIELSESSKRKLLEEINRKYPSGRFVYGKKRREAATKRLEESSIVDPQYVGTTVDSILLINQDRKDPETILKKVTELRDPKSMYTTIQDRSTFFTRNDAIEASKNDQKWQELIREYNGRVITRFIKEMNFDSQQRINTNLVNDASALFAWELKKTEEFAEMARNGEIMVSKYDPDAKGRQDFPDAAPLENTANAEAARNARLLAQSGPVESIVPIDGGYFQRLFGLSFLNHKHECNHPGESVSRSDVIALYERGRFSVTLNWRETENGILRTLDEETIAKWKEAEAKGEGYIFDQDILIYDGRECSGQPCRCHSPLTKNVASQSNFNFATNVIAKLLSHAAEFRGLQRKKRKTDRDTVADILFFEPTLDQAFSRMPTDAMEAIALAQGFRVKLARHLQSVFNAEIDPDSINNGIVSIDDDPLGFYHSDYGSEALALAQLMTPVIRIELVAPDQNGRTKFFVSIDDLTSDPSLVDWSLVKSARPKIMSLPELGNKIIRRLSNRAYGDTDLDYKTQQDIAHEALRDWSDYNVGGLTAVDILSRVSALSDSAPENIAAMDSPTARMKFLDGIDGKLTSRSKKLRNQKRIDSTLLARLEAEQDHLNLPYVIIYSSIDVGTSADLDISKWVNGNFSRLENEGDYSAPGTAAICYSASEKTSSQAINNAKNNGIPLLININAPISARDLSHPALKTLDTVLAGSQTFRIIDFSNEAIKEYYAGRDWQPSLRQLPKGAKTTLGVYVDPALTHLTDGGVWLSNKEEFHYLYEKDFSRSKSEYFKNYSPGSGVKFTGTVEIVRSKEALLDMRDDISDGRAEIVYMDSADYESLGPERARSAAEEFLNTFQNIQLYEGMKLFGASYNECIGFLKGRTSGPDGKVFYAPIVIAGSVSHGTFDISVDETPSEVMVYASKLETVDPADSIKVADVNNYLKGHARIITTADPFENQWPEFVAKNGPHIGAVLESTSGAKKSRGFEDAELYKACWIIGSHPSVGLNLFHYEESPGVWKPKPWFDNLEEGEKMGLLGVADYSDNIWAQIRNGRRITGDSALDGVLEKVARIAAAHYIPPVELCASMQLNKDGEWEAKELDPQSTYYHLLQDLSYADTLIWFNALNSKLIQADAAKSWEPGTLISPEGKAMCTLGISGKAIPLKIATAVDYLNESTRTHMPTGEGAYSAQHVVVRGLYQGLIPSDFRNALIYGMSKMGDMRGYTKGNDVQDVEEIDRTDAKYVDPASYQVHRNYNRPSLTTIMARTHQTKIAQQGKTFDHVNTVIDERDEEVNGYSQRAEALLTDAQNKLKATVKLTWREVVNIHKLVSGYTYQEGKGNDIFFMKDVETSMKLFIETVNNKDVRYLIPSIRNTRDRISLPLMPYPMIQRFAATIPAISNKFEPGESIVDGIITASMAELEGALHYITDCEDIGKKTELLDMTEYLLKSNYQPVDSEWMFGSTRMAVMLDQASGFVNLLSPEDKAVVAKFAERVKATVEKTNIIKDYNSEVRSSVAMNPSARGGRARATTVSHSDVVVGVLNAFGDATRLMALASIPVAAGNLTYRSINQTLQQAYLGIFNGDFQLRREILDIAAGEKAMRKVMATLRYSMIEGTEMSLLLSLKSGDDIEAFLDKRNEERGILKKVQNWAYGVATGGNVGQKQQIRNFWNRFVSRASTEGYKELFIEDANGMTWIESRLQTNPAATFIEIMGPDSPYRTLAQQCLQYTRLPDLAQDNLGSEVIKYAVKNKPWAQFAVTTSIVRFPQYSFNILGAMCQAVAPVSSLNYLAVNLLKAKAGATGTDGKYKQSALGDFARNMDIERLQSLSSLREAITIDAMWMSGTALVAVLLQSIPGLLEPPEDEDKWKNIEEWLICGHRVGEEWWIQDILGMHLHTAVAYKSSMLGKPQPSMIFEGIARACYNNPMLRISDAIDMLTDDPMDKFLDSLEVESSQYDKASGGAPSTAEMLSAKASAFGLSWLSQFFVPSMLRELYQDLQTYEVSYKRIYEEDGTGVLTEEGKDGKTMRTTYSDAMLRKIAKNNPIVALLADAFMRPNTPFWAYEQPRVEWYEPTQMASVNKYSLYNEDGSEKTPQEKEAIAAEVILKLMSTDDMEALYEEGFMMSPATRQYVGEAIWNTYQAEMDMWNDFVQETGLDFYVLGNGSYTEGQKVKSELTEQHYKTLADIKAIYYDRLYSQPMKRSMAVYNMYNTTFDTDANGEVYATGLRPTVFPNPLPFMTAPGTMTDPEGTMGYAGDWATPSQLNPEMSTGIRALVPVKTEYEETPKFESLAGDGAGSGYSPSYPGNNYSRSGYGYSGGGGGSRYVQDLYSHLPKSNVDTPRTMYSDRLDDARFDYLRPSVETKGSREAYKREDF